MSETRRDVLKKLVGGVVGGAVTLAIAKNTSAQTKIEHPKPEDAQKMYKKYGKVDPIMRMEAELKDALKRPSRRWIMVTDLRKCVGCYACTVSCMVENKLPPGVIYRAIMEEEVGKYPVVGLNIIPRPCLQCDNPPCVRVCPVKATWKSADGIVEMDYLKCVGCRYCIVACPYGARVVDPGRPISLTESLPSYEYSKEWIRKPHQSPINNVRKCHFCKHRIADGMLPACVVTCVGRATYFGDKMNPDSLVSELITKPNVMVLKKGLGTKPAVFYLT